MTSWRQLEANRRNSRNSTGPSPHRATTANTAVAGNGAADPDDLPISPATMPDGTIAPTEVDGNGAANAGADPSSGTQHGRSTSQDGGTVAKTAVSGNGAADAGADPSSDTLQGLFYSARWRDYCQHGCGPKRRAQSRRLPGSVRPLGTLFQAAIALSEDPDQYDLLMKRITHAVGPTDPIEWLWVPDLVDLIFDIMRMRRAKVAIIDNARKTATEPIWACTRCSWTITGCRALRAKP